MHYSCEQYFLDKSCLFSLKIKKISWSKKNTLLYLGRKQLPYAPRLIAAIKVVDDITQRVEGFTSDTNIHFRYSLRKVFRSILVSGEIFFF